MQSYYHLNQATTTLPKAPGVPQAVASYLMGEQPPSCGEEARIIAQVQGQLSDFFGGGHVHMAPNVRHGLRQLLRTCLKPGDCVLTTQVPSPRIAHTLKGVGLSVTQLPCNDKGELLLEQVPALLSEAKLVLVSHADVLCGTLLPVAELGTLCKKADVPLLVDVSLTAGKMPISLEDLQADGLLCSSDSLLAPKGLGCLLLSDKLSAGLVDYKLAGALDLSTVYGLSAALDWWQSQALTALQQREHKLAGHLIARMREMEEDGLVVLGTLERDRQIALVSVVFPDRDAHTATQQLEEQEDLTVGTAKHLDHPNGIVRFSTSVLSTFEEVDRAHGAVCHIMGV